MKRWIVDALFGVLFLAIAIAFSDPALTAVCILICLVFFGFSLSNAF